MSNSPHPFSSMRKGGSLNSTIILYEQAKLHTGGFCVRTLCFTVFKCVMQVIDDLVEAVGRKFIPMRSEYVKLDAPLSQGHFVIRITTDKYQLEGSIKTWGGLSYTTRCSVTSLIWRLTYIDPRMSSNREEKNLSFR